MSGGFEVIPAIDLLAGQAVRLSQGRYDAATVYETNPAKVAAGFAAHGIARLHAVDLDGARAGHPVNADPVRAIVEAAAGVPVQLGGGIRTLAAVEETLATHSICSRFTELTQGLQYAIEVDSPGLPNGSLKFSWVGFDGQ